MSIAVYVFGWLLVFTMCIAIVLIVMYQDKLDKCRSDTNLICWTDWKCKLSNGGTTTSGDLFNSYLSKCGDPTTSIGTCTDKFTGPGAIANCPNCPSAGDVPANPGT